MSTFFFFGDLHQKEEKSRDLRAKIEDKMEPKNLTMTILLGKGIFSNYTLCLNILAQKWQTFFFMLHHGKTLRL